MISPYNPILLKVWKANMNIQYVTGVYELVMYLSSYMCKAEHTMSELMKKASKESNNSSVADQLKPIGQVFMKHREVPLHEGIKRTISLPLRKSNIDVQYIPTGLKRDRTRMTKPKAALEKLHDDDPNIFATNLLDNM